MPEDLKSPDIYTPKTLYELIAIKAKEPDALLFAGGTYIMSRPGFYPNPNCKDIILLSGIAELSRVVHTERFLELGAMVSLNHMLNVGSKFLSPGFVSAVHEIATDFLRNQITIGGALCSPDMRYSLPCILSAVGAQAEIRTIQTKGKIHPRTSYSSRWVPVSRLYSPNGHIIIDNDNILTRIRIPAFENSIQVFKQVGDPFKTPSSSVLMGLSYSINQSGMSNVNMTVVLPSSVFYCSGDFNSHLSNINLPVGIVYLKRLSNLLVKNIKDICPSASPLQLERAKRLLETVLYDCNTSFLEG